MNYDLEENNELHERLLNLMAMVQPMRAIGVEKKRYGRDFDGGYVMLEGLERAEITYSLGICDDVSWDLIMANFGSEVFMYDHTIPECPGSHPLFRFHKIGIASSDDLAPDLRRLDTLVRQNGHAELTGMILKIDIEQHEWSCFDTIDEDILSRFDQIICEFHHTINFRNEEWLAQAERAFAKLYRTHQVIHVHGNNHAPINILAGVPIPDVFELTFASRDTYHFEPTDEVFPAELDRPCTPTRPEIYLGDFKYRATPAWLSIASVVRPDRDVLDLTDVRCVCCSGVSFDTSPPRSARVVRRGHVRCRCCGATYDVVDGVVSFGPQNAVQQTSLVATGLENHRSAVTVDEIRALNATLNRYHHFTGDLQPDLSEFNLTINSYEFSILYMKWLMISCLLGSLNIKNKELLFVGAGSGREAVRFVDMGSYVTCIDHLSTHVLAGRRSVPSARWAQGVARALPYKDETFDVIVADGSFADAGSIASALQEMVRVLKPGGSIFIAAVPFQADAKRLQPEGPSSFSAIYEPLRYFCPDVTIAIIVDVAELEDLQGSVKIASSKSKAMWVPCCDENIARIAVYDGTVGVSLTKIKSIPISARHLEAIRITEIAGL